MKIGFKQLEKLRKNPKSINDKSIIFGGRSKFTRWQDAISRYHSKGDNSDEAQKYLEATFARLADNSLNRRDLRKYSQHILEYEQDYKTLGSEQIGYRMGFSFVSLPGHTIAGQLSRVDINIATIGYNVFSFEKDLSYWESELRFPLMQKAVADYFNSPIEEVSVGIYNLKEGKHMKTSFSSKDIDIAIDELDNVLIEISKYLKP